MPDPQQVPAPVAPAREPDATQTPDETGPAPAANETDQVADASTAHYEPAPAAFGDDRPESGEYAGTADEELLPVAIGAYKVLGRLGAGGMGSVYLTEQVLMRQQFAVKVIQNDYYDDVLARERFLREVRSAFQLNSPYVVRCTYADYHDNRPFLAMELLRGCTLRDWMKVPGRRTVAEGLRFGADLFRGLAAIHDAQLVHRDIKPGNLWVEEGTRRLKVFDLGLARRYDEDTLTGGLLPQGTERSPVGTPAYMAPEQVACKALDRRADLFAAGAVLYWFFVGRSPFARGTIDEAYEAVRTFDPRPLSELNPAVPAGLSALVRKLLNKNPDDRPQDAREALAELEAVAAKLASPAGPEGLIGRTALYTDALKALSAGGVVALSGEGGMGKTAVARALAAAHRAAGGAVVWVDCAAVPRFEACVRQAAAELFAERCDTEPLEPLAGRVADAFAARAALLVLDNFEVIAGEPDVARWLCKFRAPARAVVAGRTVPAALPGALLTVPELDRASAIGLFRARARAAGQTADLPEAAVNRLCAAVGDHPLALELLAKRARFVPLENLIEGVLCGLAPLDGTARGGRHASIRACFAESLRGLSSGARDHLLALSALPAPFGYELMVAVAGTDDNARAAAELVTASLWRMDGERYSVHPLVRQVAREELGAERAAWDRRAAERVAATAKEKRTELRARNDRGATKKYLDACEAELPNLLALATDGTPAIDVAEALSAFWGARGHWDAAVRLYAAAVDAARALGDRVREAWCHEFRGYIFRHLARYDDADRAYRAALDLCAADPAARDKHYGRIAARYGKLHAWRGQFPDAIRYIEEALAEYRRAGDGEGELTATIYLGQALKFDRQLDRAEQLFRAALGRARDSAIAHSECEARFQLGDTYLRLERAEDAARELRESLRLARAAADRVRETKSLVNLGVVATLTKDWAEAQQALTEGLQHTRAMGLRLHEGRTLRRLAELCLARNAPDDRARARKYAKDALAILAASEDAWAAERARETLRRAETAP